MTQKGTMAWARCRAEELPAGHRRTACTVMVLIVGLLTTIVHAPAPHFLWNASASSPIGLYVVHWSERWQKGDLVVARLSPRARRLAAERHYLPGGVPLLKTVVGLEGDQICSFRRHIFVNRGDVAAVRAQDRRGRPLAHWTGCVRLRPGELFLLSRSPDAFDGRYFGVTRHADIIGKAKILWAR